VNSDNSIESEVVQLRAQSAQQAKIYKRLYEIGKNINETLEISQIYDIAVEFATNELNFEKCLIFEHDDANGWFKVVRSAGYEKPHEKQILKIINLLLSGEIIEYLRIYGEPLVHTQEHPKEQLAKLVKSLFLTEAYLELFGGDVEIPHGVIVIGNGIDHENLYSKIGTDQMVMLALGNFTTRLSSAVSNILFYKAWNEERNNLKHAINFQTALNVQLNKEQKFISTILNNTSAIIAIINSEGVMTRINTYGEEFTGYTQQEVSSAPFFWGRFVPPELQDKVFGIIENAKNGNIISRMQNQWVSKNGEFRYFDWANALVLNENNEMDYLITVGIDITNEIEQQKKLEKALEAAENAARVKGEFLANMSHEIRTPMNGILGFIQLFERTQLDEKQKKFVEVMHTSAKTLLGIINDILDVSKFESGKFELDIIEIDPSVEFEKVAVIFTTKLKEKNIEFIVDIDSKLGKCLKFDLLRIQQIISNLLSNAIKFTSENGKIEFYVSMLEEFENAKKLRLGVKDTGIGIAKEHHERIMEAFSQAAVSTTRKFGGTGLGLTICTRLVSLMGGKLQIESEEGVGSHFFFDITVESCRKD
jgi:PAS domain S-box-containing protein